jgi:hypothetical protein
MLLSAQTWAQYPDSRSTAIIEFAADGTAPETTYLDAAMTGSATVGTWPDGFRFADGALKIGYDFDLPDTMTSATLTLRINADYVIKLGPDSSSLTTVLTSPGGAAEPQRVYSFDVTPYWNPTTKQLRLQIEDQTTADGGGPQLHYVRIDEGTPYFRPGIADDQNGNWRSDLPYLWDIVPAAGLGVGAPGGGPFRFADATQTYIYKLDLPNSWQGAIINTRLAGARTFEVAAGTATGGPGAFTVVFNDATVLAAPGDFHHFDVSSLLMGNPEKVVYFRVSDPTTADGAGIILRTVWASEKRNDLTAPIGQNAVDFIVGTAQEMPFLYEESDSVLLKNNTGTYLNSDIRFADGGNYFVYRFDLDDLISKANLVANVEGGYNIAISTDNITYTTERSMPAGSPRINETIDLASYLAASTTNELYVKFFDATTGDGGGPQLHQLQLNIVEMVPVELSGFAAE